MFTSSPLLDSPQVIAVEPTESPVISGGSPGPHKIQGFGAGFIPGNLHTDLLTETIQVSRCWYPCNMTRTRNVKHSCNCAYRSVHTVKSMTMTPACIVELTVEGSCCRFPAMTALTWRGG